MSFFADIDRFSKNTAVIDEQGTAFTYKELLTSAHSITAEVPQRSLVFLVCENSFAAIAAYIGFLRKKIVPVMINASVNAELFAALKEQYHPAFIFAPCAIQCTQYKTLLTLDNYVLQQTDYAQDYTLHDELALLLTTSGSTGSPKLVRQSYKNIESNARSIAQYLNITESDRPIMTLPMSYTYGLSIINSHLLMGACIITNNMTLMDKGFWKLLKEQHATTFGGVPYIYEMLKKLRFARMELPCLRYLTQAGGKLSPELCAEFSDICVQKGMEFIVMYGQTEATARMSYLPWEKALEKAGSIGIAIPDGKFILEDAVGKPITTPDITGELIYYGPNVTLGYAQSRNDLALGDENGGVLHTGDMAKQDSDGYFYIVGRKKRFLKLFGNRINLDETENLLKQQGCECACAGTDDHMIIYITDENRHEEVLSFISSHTGLNRSGFTVKHIDAIPRNEAGKILYSSLK
ncbi:MAG: AMP-binding protein [Christensenella sp.]